MAAITEQSLLKHLTFIVPEEEEGEKKAQSSSSLPTNLALQGVSCQGQCISIKKKKIALQLSLMGNLGHPLPG